VLISFAIYLWIPSHIWALAYRYRHGYRKAGIPMLSALIDERKAIVIISVLNILSATYILHFIFGSGAAGFVLVLAGVAAAVATSLYTLRKATDEAMMYKTSSPILALFLIALMLH
jgi:protoheme IX farnesyltransferase